MFALWILSNEINDIGVTILANNNPNVASSAILTPPYFICIPVKLLPPVAGEVIQRELLMKILTFAF